VPVSRIQQLWNCTSCSIILRKLLNSMEQSPYWEADSSSATQEILYILQNPKVHHCFHNSLPLVPSLSLINPVHKLSPCSFKISFNAIFNTTLVIQVESILSQFHAKNPAWTPLLPRTNHTPHSSHFPGYDHPNNIWYHMQAQHYYLRTSLAQIYF